jgi:hypothetical protein
MLDPRLGYLSKLLYTYGQQQHLNSLPFPPLSEQHVHLDLLKEHCS